MKPYISALSLEVYHTDAAFVSESDRRQWHKEHSKLSKGDCHDTYALNLLDIASEDPGESTVKRLSVSA